MGLFDFLAPGKKKRTQNNQSTQTYLRIGEIRDNLLVLKNGSVRAILRTSSINFNLKSEQEQNAIVQGYQNFLNSLEFPIQIVTRSKKLDIDNYIKQIEALRDKQQNQLLKEQTTEYADYIKRLVEYADIMEKEFYVIIPYDPGAGEKPSLIQGFFQRLAPKDTYGDIKKRHSSFNKMKKSVNQRINIVKSGLEHCGLTSQELTTSEIIELFYNSYNPLSGRTSKIADINKINIENDEMPSRIIENTEENPAQTPGVATNTQK